MAASDGARRRARSRGKAPGVYGGEEVHAKADLEIRAFSASSMSISSSKENTRKTCIGGTYHPNIYLGIRARTPRSLIAGLMWIGKKDGQFSI